MELSREYIIFLHRRRQGYTVATDTRYLIPGIAVHIVAMHEIEAAPVGNILPQRMSALLINLVPAHMGNLQPLAILGQVIAKEAHLTGENAETLHPAVLLAKFHHSLHTNADAQHRLGFNSLMNHLIEAQTPDLAHTIANGPHARQDNPICRQNFFRLRGDDRFDALPCLFHGLGHGVEVTHAVVDDCNSVHDDGPMLTDSLSWKA